MTKQVAVLASQANQHSEETRIWGISVRDRLVRSLDIVGARVADPGEPISQRALYLRTDHVFDERVLEGLLHVGRDIVLEGDRGPAAVCAGPDQADRALEVLRGAPADGFAPSSPNQLASDFDPVLRRRSPPYALAVEAGRTREVEDHLFRAAYKTVTDAVTKWVWPRPARQVTRWCVRFGVTPNTVTAVSYVLALAVTVLWAQGAFAGGLLLAWCMTFLDTVDGKLARVTLRSSPFGQVFDHGLDLVHPPIWWAAWAWGLTAGEPGFGAHTMAMAVVVGGYVIGRLLEGVFLLAFRMEMFIWRPFDGQFRLVIARRNPNLVLLSLSALLGQPAWGLAAVASWTAASIAIQLVRIEQAFRTRRAGDSIETWFARDSETQQ